MWGSAAPLPGGSPLTPHWVDTAPCPALGGGGCQQLEPWLCIPTAWGTLPSCFPVVVTEVHTLRFTVVLVWGSEPVTPYSE